MLPYTEITREGLSQGPVKSIYREHRLVQQVSKQRAISKKEVREQTQVQRSHN